MALNAAVIGAGHFAYRVHIPILAERKEVRLDSVCRLGASELALVKEQFGFAFATEDWRDVLQRDIDVAVISSPHHLHYEQGTAFLEKGCHVLVEKPMCLFPSQAWELVETAKRVKREIVVSYGWNYKQHLSVARDFVSRIGPIEHAVCHMASFTRSVFTGSGAVSRWKDFKIQPEAETWQNVNNGGGFAHGQLSHALGLLFWITDLRAASVTAITTGAPGAADLHDAAIVRFDSGASGVLSGSCGVPEGHGFEVDIRLYGERGSVHLDIENEIMTLKLPGGAVERIEPEKGSWTYSCEGPANALIDLALNVGKNKSGAEIGARSVETLHALLESAHGGGHPYVIGHAAAVKEAKNNGDLR